MRDKKIDAKAQKKKRNAKVRRAPVRGAATAPRRHMIQLARGRGLCQQIAVSLVAVCLAGREEEAKEKKGKGGRGR